MSLKRFYQVLVVFLNLFLSFCLNATRLGFQFIYALKSSFELGLCKLNVENEGLEFLESMAFLLQVLDHLIPLRNQQHCTLGAVVRLIDFFVQFKLGLLLWMV